MDPKVETWAKSVNVALKDLQARVVKLEKPAGLSLVQLLVITGWIFIVCPLLWAVLLVGLHAAFGLRLPFGS